MAESGDKLAGTITHLLRDVRTGHQDAMDTLFDTVYEELKKLAVSHMENNAGCDRLEATSLVHDACHKLMNKGPLDAEDRRHFFFQFGRAMQDVLVDELRSQATTKRGGGCKHFPVIEFVTDDETLTADILDLRQALDELRRRDAMSAQIITLRYFCGLTLEDTAKTMDCSLGSVRDEWDYARAWLLERLSRDHVPMRD